MVDVDETAGVDRAPGSTSDPVPRLVALRGELWQRHSRLQTLDHHDADYDEQGAELIELTAELLRVEAEVAEVSRAARRRVSRTGFAVATVLLLVAVALGLAAPVVGQLPSRIGAAAALLAVFVVLLVTAMARRRHSPTHVGPGTDQAHAAPGSGPGPEPPSTAEPHAEGTRD
jgi:hypothetical protein